MGASYDKRIVDSHANVRRALRPTSCEQRAIGELESPRLTVHKDIGRTMPGAVLNLELSARAMADFRLPWNYRVSNSVDSVSDSRTLKKNAFAIAMQTKTAPKVQTMVAPVGKSKYTEK